MRQENIFLGKPKKTYRVLIRQTKPRIKEKMRSFMIYDADGKTSIEEIKNRLLGKRK